MASPATRRSRKSHDFLVSTVRQMDVRKLNHALRFEFNYRLLFEAAIKSAVAEGRNQRDQLSTWLMKFGVARRLRKQSQSTV